MERSGGAPASAGAARSAGTAMSGGGSLPGKSTSDRYWICYIMMSLVVIWRHCVPVLKPGAEARAHT